MVTSAGIVDLIGAAFKARGGRDANYFQIVA
jgi:hypothetical protein